MPIFMKVPSERNMHSRSTLTISWKRPELTDEEWEFSRHPAKQDFYQRHGIGWEQLLAAFSQGGMTPYPRSGELRGVPVSLSYATYDDYAHYLARAKRGYRKNYTKMEETLQREGNLALPAPIVLFSAGEALLFSGYRRLCLAWNYGMVPYVWQVNLNRPQM